jgi:uncharacterized protein
MSIQNVNGQTVATTNGASPPGDSAATLIDRNRGPNGIDVAALARDVRTAQQNDPPRGEELARTVEARLSPVERGQFAAAMDAGQIRQAEGQSFRIGDPSAPAIRDWGSAPAGSDYRQAWDSAAARIGTTDPVRVTSEIERQLYGTTSTPAAAPAAAAPATGPDPVQLGLDLTQMALDITGLVDPTPVSDGGNALISIGRAFGSAVNGNWSEAGGHLVNAGISVASILPVLGDLAKAGKIGKWAQTVADAVTAVAQNPALRATFEPALRTIRDAAARIPQGAIDALPASARESLQSMRRQLDEFVAPAAARSDPPTTPTSYRGTVGGRPVDLPGVDTARVNYVKRDREEYRDLRRAFDNGIRADFARSLVSTPEGIAAARRAGLDDDAIALLGRGRIPAGYQVHHKLPLDDGGTNDFSNLVLIRNSPYHTALTNAQRELVGDLPVGGSRQVDFPVPPGSIYPPQ